MAKKLSRKANQIATEVISLRSTLHTKMIAQQMNLDPDSWLNAKAGNDSLEFDVDDVVLCTGKGQFKKGTVVKIAKAELYGGYARYFAGGVWHKSGDLVAIQQR